MPELKNDLDPIKESLGHLSARAFKNAKRLFSDAGLLLTNRRYCSALFLSIACLEELARYRFFDKIMSAFINLEKLPDYDCTIVNIIEMFSKINGHQTQTIDKNWAKSTRIKKIMEDITYIQLRFPAEINGYPTYPNEKFWEKKAKIMVHLLKNTFNYYDNVAALRKLNNVLHNEIRWGIFGGTAVAIHRGNFHRPLATLEVVIEDDREKLRKILREKDIELTIENKGGRLRGYTDIDHIKVEFIFQNDQNAIQLSDGKFEFENVEKKRFGRLYLPVIDVQSLYRAQVRQREHLSGDPQIEMSTKKQRSLRNILKDVRVLQRLIKR
ncbi:hypothetical protein COY23_00940 [bacterium (Candidatus Torokbacteria) CG_4_10_14_0_2_um_filter_35_8]|nr:MAG: hypothetical protein COY23_00940 [bacterium (Candidatus Torokbacteria) CG_4_10_14_0_2_um_filter_35_8]